MESCNDVSIGLAIAEVAGALTEAYGLVGKAASVPDVEVMFWKGPCFDEAIQQALDGCATVFVSLISRCRPRPSRAE